MRALELWLLLLVPLSPCKICDLLSHLVLLQAFFQWMNILSSRVLMFNVLQQEVFGEITLMIAIFCASESNFNPLQNGGFHHCLWQLHNWISYAEKLLGSEVKYTGHWFNENIAYILRSHDDDKTHFGSPPRGFSSSSLQCSSTTETPVCL